MKLASKEEELEEIIVISLELLFVYPGAFIRWILFYRKTMTIKEVAKDDLFKNSYVGILTIGFIVGCIYWILGFL